MALSGSIRDDVQPYEEGHFSAFFRRDDGSARRAKTFPGAGPWLLLALQSDVWFRGARLHEPVFVGRRPKCKGGTNAP